MAVIRYTVRWGGFTGAPGFTNFHFGAETPPPSQAVLDATAVKVRAFFNTFATNFPSGLSISFPGEVDQLNTGTGALENVYNVPVQTVVTGSASGTYGAGVGACIAWTGFGLANGRRPRGRTFLVPLAPLSFQTDGTLADTFRTNLVTAANTLADDTSGLPLMVWHRPVSGVGGSSHQVVSASVTDKTAILRSRRD